MNPEGITTAQPPEAGDQQIAGLLSEWAGTIFLRLRGGLHLAMAETKLAVTTFVMMIFLVVLAGGFLVMAWGLLLVALVQALSLAGLQLAVAMLSVAALHVVLAWVLWRLANRLGRHMEFRATRGLLES